MRSKLICLIIFICVILTTTTQIFAEYTGPNSGARRYDYVCGSEPCNCSMGCGGEDTGGYHYDEGSGVGCQGNSPQVFCDTCDVHCTANYPDAAISISAFCSTGFGKDGWCRGEVTVVATGTDENFKITGIEDSDGTLLSGAAEKTMTQSFTYSGEQMRTVEFWAHSGLGDTSSKATYDIKIDLTDPVNDIEYTGTLSEQNWYKGPVVITSKATDTFLNFTKVNPEHWDVVYNEFTTPNTFSGSVTPKIYSEDLAGNHAGWDTFPTIHIDNELPVIKNLYDPKGKWFSAPVPLMVVGDDNHSGVLSGYIFVDDQDIGERGNACSTSYTPNSEGVHTVKYQVEDRANNKSEQTGEYTFGYDVTAPVVKLKSNQSFDIVGVSITVSGSVTDNLSGAKSVEIKYGKDGAWIPVTTQPASGTTDGTWAHTMNRATAEGFNLFYVRATDIAGNMSSGTEVSFTLNHDYTAPETVGMHTEGVKGEGGVYRDIVTFIGEAEDSVAGVKSIFVDLGLGGGEKQNQDKSPEGHTGIITACVRAVDNVDNSTECIKQDGVLVDNTKPTIASIDTLDTSKVFTPETTFSVSGSDAHAGMYSVTISIDGTPFTNLGDTNTVELGSLGDGTHVVTVELKDNAGNTLNSEDDDRLRISNIVTDGTKPSASITKPTDGTYAKDTLDFNGNISDNIGVEKAVVKIDNSIVKEYGPYTGTSANITDTIDITEFEEGTHTIELISYDKAGNASDSYVVNFIIDRTAPDVSVVHEGIKGDGGVYRGQVTFTGEATDTGVGVQDIYVDAGNGQKRNTDKSAEGYSGNLTVCVRAVDKLGNDSGCVKQDPVLIDNTKPYPVSYTNVNSKTVFVAEDTFDVSGDDEHSGMYSVSIVLDGSPRETSNGSSASLALESLGDGPHVIEFLLTDNAGNVYNSADDPNVNTGEIVIDTTGPVVTVTKPTTGDYAKDVVHIEGTAEDNIGLDRVVISVDGTPVKTIDLDGVRDTFSSDIDTSSLPEGDHTITVQAFDQGNNPSEPVEIVIHIDRTAPTVSMHTEGTKGEGGVYRGVVNFVGEAEDAGAGVADIFVDLGNGENKNSNKSEEGFSGTITACVRAVDKVGNDSGCIKQDSVLIDNEKPYPSNYTDLTQKVVFTADDVFEVTGKDNHSGMYSVTIVLDNSPVSTKNGDNNSIALNTIDDGEHEIEFLLTDNAGNVYNSADDPNVNTGRIVIDKTGPEVTVTEPSTGDYAKDVVHIEGTAEDNIGLDRVVISVDGTPVKTIDLEGTHDTFSSDIDTSSLPEGDHTITVQAFDQGNNPSEPVEIVIHIDRTAPTVSMHTEGTKGEGGVYRGVVNFVGEAEDAGAGVADIFVDLGNGENKNSNKSEEGFSGTITACVRAVDKVGNDSGCIKQDSVLIDNEKPYPSNYTDLTQKVVFTADDVFEVTGKDNHSGMYSVTIVLDNSPVSTKNGDNNSIALNTIDDGEHEIEFLLTDNAGNVYNSADDPNVNTGKIVIDKTGAKVSLDKPVENQRVGDSVNVVGSAEDNIGLDRVVISIDGEPVKELALTGTSDTFDTDIDTKSLSEGEHIVSAQAFDQGNNPSNVEKRKIIVDHTPPVCHIEIRGERGAGGYFRGAIELVTVCEDNGKELTCTEPGTCYMEIENHEELCNGNRCGYKVDVPDDFTGEITPRPGGVDEAGNDSGPQDSDPIYMPDGTILDKVMIDNNPPTVTDFFTPPTRWINVDYLDMFVEGKDDEGPLYSGSIIVNEDESNILTENDHSDLRYNMDEGISSLKYYVEDLAGNKSDIVGIDQ